MTRISNNNKSRQGQVRALVLTGYGLNCDYETDYSLRLAGAQSRRAHINEIIARAKKGLSDYHILVFGGGFSWADDHGAGVLMATKLRHQLGDQIKQFIEDGRLVIGICNGFQCLVNMGLLPGFDNVYEERRVALTFNDSGNFIDAWVKLRVNQNSHCIFTKGIKTMDLPVRHGEGKIVADDDTISALFSNNQVAMQYADESGDQANGAWPFNPNGSIKDIAGICDKSGRIFGLMPHPEAFNHYTNHPGWTRKKEELRRQGKTIETEQGEGIRIFKNAVDYIRATVMEI
ncbi:Phosphoribosylformylglycinamidine synthase 1 [uncultured Desulfobacterium sp.]|uniref:Phosphoribosylformylglycinamidine synthase 1 n=1 Tax=uncultured Desulfobacterium sp. TaxID=201089 RepID=A0A445MQL8_9BACT|nr:Phosphoribosylformylglycinamidine synthase 1 [uncultured Desulfobacterium sp.]